MTVSSLRTRPPCLPRLCSPPPHPRRDVFKATLIMTLPGKQGEK